jgi:ribosomal protein S6--L-glutamate ligase
MKIHIISDWLNPTIQATLTALGKRGVEIRCLFPEEQMMLLSEIRNDADLYVLKSGTELALGLAGCLHMQGAAIINPYPTVAMLRNKIIVTQALHAAGLPVPATYVTANPDELLPILGRGPLLLKPYRGSRGEGIRLVRNADELGELPAGAPILAQQYLAPDGPDHKLFRIGQRLFGVKRIWPLRSYDDKTGTPFEPDQTLRDLALRVGEIFGIDLYGLDVIYSDGRPYIVDVNKFGSYVGVPNGPQYLADYIYEAGLRAQQRGASAPKSPAPLQASHC